MKDLKMEMFLPVGVDDSGKFIERLVVVERMFDDDFLFYGRVNRPAKRKLFRDEFKVREKREKDNCGNQ